MDSLFTNIVGGFITLSIMLGIFVLMGYIKKSRILKEWSLLIKRYNLILTEPKNILGWILGDLPHSDGEIEGFEVRIDGRSVGSYAMNNYSRCQFKIDNIPEDFNLNISKYGIVDSFFTAIGVAPIKTGNEEFNKKFSLSCSDETLFNQIFSPEIVAYILTKSPEKGHYWIKDSYLRFEVSHNTMSGVKEHKEFQEAIEIVISLSKLMRELFTPNAEK